MGCYEVYYDAGDVTAFEYSIGIRGGFANDTPKGWTVSRDCGFVLELAQRR